MGDHPNPCRKETEDALRGACVPVGKSLVFPYGRADCRRARRNQQDEGRRKAIRTAREERRSCQKDG